jgi:hypothetical protein
MSDLDIEITKETETQETVEASDVLEIGDVEETKGGFGTFGDGHGGLVWG